MRKFVEVPIEELQWIADMAGGCSATIGGYAADAERGGDASGIQLEDAQQCEAELEYIQLSLKARIRAHRRGQAPAPTFSLVGGLENYLSKREPWKSLGQ